MVKGVVTKDCGKVDVRKVRIVSDDINTVGVEAEGVRELKTKDIEIINKSPNQNGLTKWNWKTIGLFIVGAIGLLSSIITIKLELW